MKSTTGLSFAKYSSVEKQKLITETARGGSQRNAINFVVRFHERILFDPLPGRFSVPELFSSLVTKDL